MTRPRYRPSRLALVMAFTCASVRVNVIAQAFPAAPTELPSTYRESIPGTLVSFDMVLVPGGKVTLEGTGTDVQPFFVSRTEVTWDLYDVFALGLDKRTSSGGADATARPSSPYGAPDYGWGHAGYPAISVAHSAAQAFCEWLSDRTGKTYRLPSEAEWARAADLATGGSPWSRPQIDAVAWHRANAAAKTHPVAARKPDALGLYDLFGNAAEWVVTADGQPVVRGGSFRDPAEAVGPRARAAQNPTWNERDPQLPKSRWWLSDGPFVGFRIVRTP